MRHVEYERAPARVILRRLATVLLLLAVILLFFWPIVAAFKG